MEGVIKQISRFALHIQLRPTKLEHVWRPVHLLRGRQEFSTRNAFSCKAELVPKAPPSLNGGLLRTESTGSWEANEVH